jgi:hypothetical protein
MLLLLVPADHSDPIFDKDVSYVYQSYMVRGSNIAYSHQKHFRVLQWHESFRAAEGLVILLDGSISYFVIIKRGERRHIKFITRI